MARMWRAPLAAGLLLVLAGPAPSVGETGIAAPQDLDGSYDSSTGVVTLSWSPGDHSQVVYYVYRDDTLIGSTEATSFSDPGVAADSGYLYFVTAAREQKTSDPAIKAIPTLPCEVVSVQTSWSYPYVYVHTHMECLGGITIDKDVAWTSA